MWIQRAFYKSKVLVVNIFEEGPEEKQKEPLENMATLYAVLSQYFHMKTPNKR